MDNTAQIKHLQNRFLIVLFAIFFFGTFSMGVDFRLPDFRLACDSILCVDSTLQNQHINPQNERERERERVTLR
ncbi:hypothetical protein [Helicobacter sp. T3_23-1056]